MHTYRCIFSGIFAFMVMLSSLSAQHAGNIRYNNPALKPPPPAQWEDPKLATQTPNPDFYRFEVKTLYNAEATAYSLIYNLTQLGKDAQEADSLLQSRIRPFMADCKKLGIPAADFFVDMVTQVPIFDLTLEKRKFNRKTYREVPLGIEVQKNLHITFSDGLLLDQINTAAARYDIFDLVKVDYLITKPQSIYHELRKQAIAYHQENLEQYKALGIDLDTFQVSFVDQTGVYYPLKRYQDYTAVGAASLEKVRNQDEVKTIRKPQTMYYQKLSDEAFHVVVEPIVNKPLVQYTYHLVVQYRRIEKPKPEPKPEPKAEVIIKREKEFSLVTPEGKVVPLFVREEKDE